MRAALIGLALISAVGWTQPSVPGNAERGERLLRPLGCGLCHGSNGAARRGAPDLARRTGRGYTPEALAARLWNHTPAIWAAAKAAAVDGPRLSEQEAADLFAFFDAARYFDAPGDAGRGKRVFQAKSCSTCHGLATRPNPLARPARQWAALFDPIELAGEMWNHAAQMKPEMTQRQIAWPQLTSQDLADLVAYLQSVAGQHGGGTRMGAVPAVVVSARNGEALFEAKGCGLCHTGSRSHAGRYSGRTMTDFAVAMWNHAPRMAEELPVFTPGEMRDLVGYLWTLQIFDQAGDPERGRRVFAARGCPICHDGRTGAAAPASPNTPLHAFQLVEILWRHRPAMIERMKKESVPWPPFSEVEIRDLSAYLKRSFFQGPRN